MTLPRARAYKSFKIGELYYKVEFDQPKYDKRLDTSTTKTAEFSVPLVNAKHGDNGIMYYGRSKIFPTEEMTIDIVQNGAIATGDVYPQPQSTGVLWDAYLIKARNHKDTPRTLCYIAAAIYKSIKHKYSYDDKAYWDFVSEDEIKLPVDETGKIDFDFMEETIRALEQARIRTLEQIRIRSLEAYRIVTGLADTSLSVAEEAAIASFPSCTKTDFKISRLFTIQKVRHMLQKREALKTKGFPVYSSNSENNGIVGYTTMPEFVCNEENPIYVVFGDHTRTMNIAEKSFSVLDNVKVLLPCTNNIECLLFMFAIWRRNIPNLGYARHWSVAKKAVLRLPVDEAGEIDFNFMELFMNGMMKKAISGVMERKDHEITTTKNVVKSTADMSTIYNDAPEEEESLRLAADENGE